MKPTIPALLAAACLLLPAAAGAQEAAQRAHEAREHHMNLYAFNLGPLAGMARGQVEFNAEAAAIHAGNIAALAGLNEAGYWVEGSDTESLEDSRALPVIWENLDDVQARMATLAEKASAAQAAAAEGPEAFTAAFAEVGQTCGGCHEKYREPE